MERTLLIIKPDAVEANNIGNILKIIVDVGFTIKAMRMTRLTRDQAAKFYGIHEGKPFFESLLDYMTSGKIVPVALERENAVAKLREVLGATDPAKADTGTIRNLYGSSIERNASHGSDSAENGKIETAFFFGEMEY
ncbi:nucleoside-diphosphate kinase [candidate division LCP-89 bacterium B3_LCP]|uniref:nucleoside-diphosphate kinase n=1 Tax=candidate division LCP-89 bacterium B3_LCP TaxID=2012998 RepID=A0A532V5M5_UNCL8|nr:MAG: nucleoside-diphosphate kinase [candidate division LCP-89 bacterium B3_LCP]